MKLFPGARRRTYVLFDRGRAAHLRKVNRVSLGGPITWCGRVGGREVGWTEAGALELCGTCGDVSGLIAKLEAAS